MKAKSIKGKSTEEIKQALQESQADGFSPTLALLFLSVVQDRNAICRMLDESGIAVFGVTTNGEFIDEQTGKGSVVLLLLDISREYFKLYYEHFPPGRYRETSGAIAKKAKEDFEEVAFLLAISNPASDGEQVLYGIQEVAGEAVTAFGAGAGDDYAFTKTFVFTNGWESEHGMLVLAIDESKVQVKGIATCGWKAVGTEKTVTRSVGNHVITIDDEPALDITTKFGGLENITPDNKDAWIEVAANFPLQLQREKGDPVMRPGLVVDWSDRSFFCSGTVPQGSKVRFSVPPDWDVMNKVVESVQKLKEEQMPEADAVVVFSCAGRILCLGPLMPEEIAGINKVWNMPMAGMFSNAELGRATGGNLEMHNLTTCCIALKEIK
ncbi:MAG TPA: FIST N-terminal domain-containing protein [Lacibacter sp.]|mgnify:CR=1 FL=1|nr:FIST N-terminal domain-containing protein [Lacibacter sp.]HMO90197.1 FIST N-terminal domain-containing protein [Lacibacter sp.]